MSTVDQQVWTEICDAPVPPAAGCPACGAAEALDFYDGGQVPVHIGVLWDDAQLAEKGVINAEDAALYRAGFETLTMFQIRENLKTVQAGQSPDHQKISRERI